MPEFNHVSVLKEELTSGIITDRNGIYCDMTLGGAGHSKRLLELTDKAVLLGIDRDPLALEVARERLSDFSDRVKLYHGNFSEIDIAAWENEIDAFDGIMADLGVSSPQLDDADRGFSYMHDAPLDMRMDTTSDFSAYDVVNKYSEAELMRIIGSYGEERWAKRIAEFIVKNRPVKTTLELVDIIKAAVPAGAREKGGHPAKRTFQAIRIEVNGELEAVENALGKAVSLLKSGGRIGVITFHSLEDRLVKQTFQTLAKGCTCPSSFPVCVCGKQPEIKIITKKPILPADKEIIENSRAKSAKLRIAEKL
ncbi:MAG: 16S rRNA (cytosine(1402)-N(4))-methyltransferase RsmH [Clostridia bacterium]|nr:16S rRNA (cytosine(1402)-N(4))-methyltransferase RsmH [Clostridia bacterium]